MSSSYTPYPPPSAGPNERRRYALEDVDKAKFSWFHVRVCAVAGIGFFTDAYDLFAINIASTMLGFVYGEGGQLSKGQDLAIKVARYLNCNYTKLLFGWLADLVGRKRMYGLELCIIIVGTLGQAVSGEGPAASVVGVIIMWRVIVGRFPFAARAAVRRNELIVTQMGVGIGGDYPLSAVISSEFAATRTRGRLMTAVFATQGFGNLAASLIAVIVVAAYKQSILSDSQDIHKHGVDSCWRLLLGLGCVPGAIALYFRLTIPETPRFTMDVERNLLKATQDVEEFIKQTGPYIVDPDAPMKRIQAPLATRRDFLQHFSRVENAKILFAAAYSWFALDIAFYGLGLNSSTVLEHVYPGAGGELDDSARTLPGNVYKILSGVSRGNVVISVAGLIPGYLVAFLFIDRWGRKPMQLLGFGMLFIIFLIMGFAYHAILDKRPPAFIFLYCLANFFENFGPNTTTFIVPGEAFPTRYRSTAHGICAASGKFGAIIAQVAFNYLKDKGDGKGKNRDARLDLILKIFAFFMLSGVFSTLLLPETMGKSLEEISNENQHEFATYGAGAPSSASRLLP